MSNVKEYKFVAFDPSITNTAAVVGICGEDRSITPWAGVIFKTKPNSSTKSKIDDYITRCHILFTQVLTYITAYKPDIIFVESPMGSQSNSAAKSFAAMCMMTGAIRTIASEWNCKVITVTPIAVKKAALERNSVEKSEMIDWAMKLWPDFPWHLTSGGRVLNENEHLADCFGIVLAGIDKLNEDA
jgi:Holliday junction resolvasome RuvABC endonuclease subunit